MAGRMDPGRSRVCPRIQSLSHKSARNSLENTNVMCRVWYVALISQARGGLLENKVVYGLDVVPEQHVANEQGDNNEP
jgi:hypothetical protein